MQTNSIKGKSISTTQAIKELAFPVSLGNSFNGDVNADGVVNILDIVLLGNMVLSDEYDSTADLNNDGLLNVLDIVVLVDTILNP